MQGKRVQQITDLKDFGQQIRQLISAAQEAPRVEDEATVRRLHQALALLWAASDTLEAPRPALTP